MSLHRYKIIIAKFATLDVAHSCLLFGVCGGNGRCFLPYFTSFPASHTLLAPKSSLTLSGNTIHKGKVYMMSIIMGFYDKNNEGRFLVTEHVISVSYFYVFI